MTDNYAQNRIKEIYDAYERNGRTKDYTITMEPINGNGDIHVELVRSTKIDKLTKEIVIKKGDDLTFIQQEGILLGD